MTCGSIDGVRRFDEARSCVIDGSDCVVRVRHPGHVHLPDEQGARVVDLETARAARQRCRGAQACDDGRFLDDEGHDAIAAIDDEIRRNAHGQAEYANDVFDHAVGRPDREHVMARQQARGIRGRQPAELLQARDAIGGR